MSALDAFSSHTVGSGNQIGKIVAQRLAPMVNTTAMELSFIIRHGVLEVVSEIQVTVRTLGYPLKFI